MFEDNYSALSLEFPTEIEKSAHLLGIVRGIRWDNISREGEEMPRQKRVKTKYPGVYYIEGEAVGRTGKERIYYIFYRKDGKQVEEKAGRQYQDDMTAGSFYRAAAYQGCSVLKEIAF